MPHRLPKGLAEHCMPQLCFYLWYGGSFLWLVSSPHPCGLACTTLFVFSTLSQAAISVDWVATIPYWFLVCPVQLWWGEGVILISMVAFELSPNSWAWYPKTSTINFFILFNIPVPYIWPPNWIYTFPNTCAPGIMLKKYIMAKMFSVCIDVFGISQTQMWYQISFAGWQFQLYMSKYICMINIWYSNWCLCGYMSVTCSSLTCSDRLCKLICSH